MTRKRAVARASQDSKKMLVTLANRDERLLSPYDKYVLNVVGKNGGFYNAHAHLDRADTLDNIFLAHMNTTPLAASSFPLAAKQDLVGDYHRGIGYTEENLRTRMRGALERQVAYGVTRLDTNVDATPDLPEDGQLAIRVALELKEEFKSKIAIKVAPTPIFGFKYEKNETPGRWEVFKEAAKQCDYLSLLPEKDDYTDRVKKDGRVGFQRHIRMGLELGCEMEKEVQFHLDQANVPGERGTELLLEGLDWVDQPTLENGAPAVWVVHMISPSAYPEERFARLIDGLLKHNVGVIVCPTAAISMRQLRSLDGPIHNSIARVLELIKRGVPIRIGTDNIGDVFVPASDGDMLTEIKMAVHATRLNSPYIWAQLASGKRPTNIDIAAVGDVLYQERKACKNVNPAWKAAVE